MSAETPTSGASVVYAPKFVGRLPTQMWLYVEETGNLAKRITSHNQVKSSNTATQLVFPQATTIENGIIARVNSSHAMTHLASMFSDNLNIQALTSDRAAKILRVVIETISMHALGSAYQSPQLVASLAQYGNKTASTVAPLNMDSQVWFAPGKATAMAYKSRFDGPTFSEGLKIGLIRTMHTKPGVTTTMSVTWGTAQSSILSVLPSTIRALGSSPPCHAPVLIKLQKATENLKHNEQNLPQWLRKITQSLVITLTIDGNTVVWEMPSSDRLLGWERVWRQIDDDDGENDGDDEEEDDNSQRRSSHRFQLLAGDGWPVTVKNNLGYWQQPVATFTSDSNTAILPLPPSMAACKGAVTLKVDVSAQSLQVRSEDEGWMDMSASGARTKVITDTLQVLGIEAAIPIAESKKLDNCQKAALIRSPAGFYCTGVSINFAGIQFNGPAVINGGGKWRVRGTKQRPAVDYQKSDQVEWHAMYVEGLPRRLAAIVAKVFQLCPDASPSSINTPSTLRPSADPLPPSSPVHPPHLARKQDCCGDAGHMSIGDEAAQHPRLTPYIRTISV